jgi:hypothetical protein
MARSSPLNIFRVRTASVTPAAVGYVPVVARSNSVDQVKIYSHPSAMPFAKVAILDANSKSAFGPGGQKSVDKVIERLKMEAAKLGANGVTLEDRSRGCHLCPS